MIAIEVKRCETCGALEDVHTMTDADGDVTIELSCRCGKSPVRTVELAKGEGYWLKVPVIQHTDEAGERESDGDDQDPGKGDV